MPRESKKALNERAAEICRRLDAEYPDATCALLWEDPWQLVVATILSAQTTDEIVNKVTPGLFAKYPTPEAFAGLEQLELEREIASIGLFRNKSKSITGAARGVMERFGGEVPATMAELLTLPGVARKTANVVLGTAFGVAAGVVVDTHVSRLSVRMGLTPVQQTKAVNTDRIEKDLMALIPQENWIAFGHCMVWHGRRACQARRPDCAGCVLSNICPKVGTQ
jgi:endonuclease III